MLRVHASGRFLLHVHRRSVWTTISCDHMTPCRNSPCCTEYKDPITLRVSDCVLPLHRSVWTDQLRVMTWITLTWTECSISLSLRFQRGFFIVYLTFKSTPHRCRRTRVRSHSLFVALISPVLCVHSIAVPLNFRHAASENRAREHEP